MRSNREILKEVGRKCRKFRIEMGYYQTDVARELGYSLENISSFENGRNDNAIILLWYITHGMPMEKIIEGD